MPEVFIMASAQYGFMFCGKVRDLPLLFRGWPPEMTLLEYLRRQWEPPPEGLVLTPPPAG